MKISDISKYLNRFFIVNSTVISAYSFIGRFADNHKIKNQIISFYCLIFTSRFMKKRNLLYLILAEILWIIASILLYKKTETNSAIVVTEIIILSGFINLNEKNKMKLK